jgi:hypothetical protein
MVAVGMRLGRRGAALAFIGAIVGRRIGAIIATPPAAETRCMARRIRRKNTKQTVVATLAVSLLGLIAAATVKFFQTVGFVIPALAAAAVIGLYFAFKVYGKHRQLAMLRAKYQDEEVAQRVFSGFFWQGQTAEQLRDALGDPADIDSKLLKTKKKEVWKYGHRGGTRYDLRITLDDDRVVGWDQK